MPPSRVESKSFFAMKNSSTTASTPAIAVATRQDAEFSGPNSCHPRADQPLAEGRVNDVGAGGRERVDNAVLESLVRVVGPRRRVAEIPQRPRRP